MLSQILFRTGASAACLLAAGVAARAATIGVSYSFAGAATGPPVISGGFLTVNGHATGTFDQFNSFVNAAWNPVIFDTMNHANLATGLNNGSFIMTFATGETLFGNLFEDDSVLIANDAGNVPQTLTFTGGTGEFAASSGSVSGRAVVTATGFSTSGSGTLTYTGISSPEPGTMGLLLTGLGLLGLLRRRSL